MKVKKSVVANQSVAVKQKTGLFNRDGKLISEWGDGDYEIPVIVDAEPDDDQVIIAGVKKRDLRNKRVCSRNKQVVFVRGSKEEYDAIMSMYSKEFKAEDRDRRCMISGKDGKLIRCPEQVADPVTGEKKCNSCKNCPYYYSLDKKSYYTATFSDLSSENEDGEEVGFDPGTEKNMGDGERYYRILEDLIESVREKDPILADIIRLKEDGMSQSKIGEQVALDQRRVGEKLKAFMPEMKQFLDNLLY